MEVQKAHKFLERSLYPNYKLQKERNFNNLIKFLIQLLKSKFKKFHFGSNNLDQTKISNLEINILFLSLPIFLN